MAYIPPEGDKLPLNFVGGPYTPPAGHSAALEFRPSDGPVGDAQYLFPPGWVSSTVSVPVAQNTTITPPGWASGAWGTPSVVNFAKAIYPGGIAPPPATGDNEFRQVPSPWISYWTRTLDLNTPSRGVAPPAFPVSHVIAAEIQYLDLAGRGIDSASYGTSHRIEYTFRSVYPFTITSQAFGSALIARVQVIQPAGWANTNHFGDHQLDINLQRILLVGYGIAAPAITDQHQLRNAFEYVRPQHWESLQFNFPVVYNLKQEVFVQKYADDADPTEWPPYYPFVENKIRHLRPSGWMSSRFSVIGNIIENGARALCPSGWDGFTWGQEGFIAHYTRYVAPESWDSFYSTHYHVVYNDAKLVRPTGWVSGTFGVPDPVLNLNRTITHHSGPADGFYGTAFVADAIRYVAPRVFVEPFWPVPEIRLNPYPIAPAGIPIPPTTAPHVREHFNILRTFSVNVHSVPWVGEPFIRNRNMTLAVYPSDQAEYGRARVFNYNTHLLNFTAGDLSQWGAHLISYRTKTLHPAPVSLPVFSVLHRIKKDAPDPPAQQVVVVPTVNHNGDGTFGIVPHPTMNYQSVFPTGFRSSEFTPPRVHGNGIRVGSMVNVDNFGFPTMVGTQYAYPPSIPRSIAIISGQPEPDAYGDSDDYWTKNLDLGYEWPRLSPHTVYAPQGSQVTSQAVMNNPPYPEPEYHTIDGQMAAGYADSRNPFFGNTWISLKHRIIGPVPDQSPGAWNQLDPSSVVSDGATVDLRIRYLYPEGIRSMRFGRVVFWGVPQFVYLMDDEGGIRPGDWYDLDPPSIHTVAFAELHDRPVYPAGFTGVIGVPTIELFNREVSPQGIPHRGNPQEGFTNPWGTALVGYPREYEWGGYDFTLWGDAWFSHYTREVQPEGWNSLSLENDFVGEFDARMRVRLISHSRTVSAVGQILGGVVGQALVEFSNRIVQARPVYPGSVGDHRVVSVISPTGWDSLEVGNIDEWEAGKIKAHGDDLSVVGYPRMGRILSPLSFDSMEFSAARLARPIYVAGMPEIGFDGPALTNPFGCMNRVVVTSPIISMQAVPAPAVAHE